MNCFLFKTWFDFIFNIYYNSHYNTSFYKNIIFDTNSDLKYGDIVTAEMFTKIQGGKVLERKLGSIVDK